MWLSFHICPPKRGSLFTRKTSAPWLSWILSKVKGHYVQRITVSQLSFQTISRTNSSLWILALINQQRNLSQTSSTQYADRVSKKLSNWVAPDNFKVSLNWVIWNLFMFGGLLRWYIESSQTPTLFYYQRSRCCRDQRGYHHMCKRLISSHE